MQSISVRKVEEKFDLKNFTPGLDTVKKEIVEPDINRLALQLTGYFEHFQETRVQLIGKVEYTYLVTKMEAIDKYEVYKQLFYYHIPCIIFTRDLEPDEDMLRLANECNVPLLGTSMATGDFMAKLITYLASEFAPSVSVHGVLVDVYGVGVLITGESGIGKSEAALELVRRGHRLVADDVVHIKRLDETTLIGSAPALTKYMLEVRGIGIIDIQNLFGFESVMEETNVDLVLKLSEWKKGDDFDRLGLNDEYVEYLGNKVICQSLPIRPGRNVAVIAEVAAVNHRQKKMGYNAAKTFMNRVQANIDTSMKGELH